MASDPERHVPSCGRPTETVSEENYFFKLSAFQDKLMKLYAEIRISFGLKPAATK